MHKDPSKDSFFPFRSADDDVVINFSDFPSFFLQRGDAHDGEDVAEYMEDSLYFIAAFALSRE